jgi:hypothetical protein
MNHATRKAAASLGVYAGLLGMTHGVYEVLQGNIPPESLVFNAIGPPCVASETASACLPAMSVIPNTQLTGILTILVGLAMVVWAAAFIHRDRGSLVMILLSISLLLVGGGFIPPMIGILSGAIASRINAALFWRRPLFSERTSHNLSRLWPWILVAYFSWILLQLVIGQVFTGFVLMNSSLFLFIEFGLLVLVVLSAFAYDMKAKTA